MRTRSLFPALLGLILAASVPLHAAPVNPVGNPGFEDWTKPKPGDAGLPTGWVAAQSALDPASPLSGSITKDTTTKHGGTASARLTNGAGTDITELDQLLPAEPNTRYTIKLWVKGENIKPGAKNGIGVMAWVNTGPKQGFYPHQTYFNQSPKIKDGTFDWQPFEFTVETGKEVGQMSLNLQLRVASGKAWLDDVQVTKLGPVVSVQSF